jgi:hypothetical protein
LQAQNNNHPMNRLAHHIFGIIAVLIISGTMPSCKTNNDPEKIPASSAYISRVFDYQYAPGQHAKLAKLSDTINVIGEPTADKGWLYLGGFGGYVVGGFDHNVLNGDGADFEIYALKGVSSEPGIVYVMSDSNADGKPNDTWYELKGNQLGNSKRNYWVRYYKAKNDTSNVAWKDSEGARGELSSGYGAKCSVGWWWPACVADSVTFSGSRLPDSYKNQSLDGSQYWVVPDGLFTYGYVKNFAGTDYDAVNCGNLLDISNAVDAAGNAVSLKSIRFVKVQTAVFQQAGWLNEVSTEIRGAKDLRM